MMGYYRRFIPDFSKISKPITELLKNQVKFVWSPECGKAFETLKNLLTTAPVLVQPDIEKLLMSTVMHLALVLGVY